MKENIKTDNLAKTIFYKNEIKELIDKCNNEHWLKLIYIFINDLIM